MNLGEFIKTMSFLSFKDRLTEPLGGRLILLLAFLLCCLWLYGSSVLAGGFGKLGQDSDDIMRYIQIQDWLNGQSWFDTDQYRLGLASGTDMHWSRLPDIPIALLTLFFEMFMSQEKALHLAAAIWPPILGLGFLAILNLGAKYIATPALLNPTRLAALSLGLVFVALMRRFNPGSIDHHNIQIILILGSIVWLIKHQVLKYGVFSGICAGFAIAIGPEVYPFVGLIGVFVACDWAWFGRDRRNRSLGFGLGFALSLAVLFVVTVRPSDWAVVYCDQLSSVTVIIAIIGGLGLSLSAQLFSSKPFLARLTCLFGVGISCLAFLTLFAPQCIGNPLSDLPETMHVYWLNNITEAKPLLNNKSEILFAVSYRIGTALIAVLVLLWSLFSKRFESYRILFSILLIASIILTFYQVRFYIFAQMVAILPLSYWIVERYQDGKSKKNNIAYLGAIFLSLPIFLALPSLLIKPSENNSSNVVSDINCLPDSLIARLNQFSDRLIFTQSNSGPVLLKLTNHRVLNANYHRNVDGIESVITINSSSVDQAKRLMTRNKVGLVLTCEKENLVNLYQRDFPNGFAVSLSNNNLPDGLVEIKGSWNEQGAKLYKVLD